MQLSLPKEQEHSCWTSSKSLHFQWWNWSYLKNGNFHARWVQICSAELNLSTHRHLDTYRCQVSITVHNQSSHDLRWSKQCHGKEIGHLKGEEWRKRQEKIELICVESLWGQSNLSVLNLSVVFNKEKEEFWPGHDERLNLSGIWTYPKWTYQVWTVFTSLRLNLPHECSL